MNYYTYTIWFVDGYYYHGYSKYKGKDPLNDGYYGSPVTHKEKWLTTMHWKEITGTYETLDEVTFAEQGAIRPVFNTDPYCLNANCNGIIPPELARIGAKKAGKKTGKKHRQNKTAICDPINQEKGRQTARERGSGFFDAEFQQSEMMKQVRKDNGKKSGDLAAMNGQLAAARAKIDPEKRRETCRQTALKLQAEGRGLGGIPYEVRAERSSKVAKKVCASKWEDPNHPEIGIHNPGNLVKTQKRLGLPHGKENRRKIG
jgi:hypothetical protein